MRKAKTKIAKLGAFAVASVMTAAIAVPTLGALAWERDTSYTSFDDVLHAGSETNLELAAEGFVLLKNKSNALPLTGTSNKVSLLGGNAYSVQYGGGGSGQGSRPGATWASQNATTIYDAFEASQDFNVNPGIRGLYITSGRSGLSTYGWGGGSSALDGISSDAENKTYMEKDDENGTVEFGAHKYKTADDGFLKAVESTFTEYGDVAIINVMRDGSEGSDGDSVVEEEYSGNDMTSASHADSGNQHKFTFNDYERQLFAYAKQQKEENKFSKIVVLINSASVMEIGDLVDDDAFDAILWIDTTGWNGADVIPDILTGKINPSGHLVDFWMRDALTDPTWYNVTDYSGAKDALDINGDVSAYFGGGDPAPALTFTQDTDLNVPSANGMSYSEGIFAGYRYYESVWADLEAAETGRGDAWYDSVTAYPFGYGLSYTIFTQEIKSVSGDLTNADGNITVTVTVKNTGSKAGKEVVQLYVSKPYTPGGIDKAAVDLVGFAKTNELAPNASQDVEVTIAVKDLASFDYNDANQNGNSGYELEAGEYVLSIRSDSHTVLDSETLTRSGDALTWDEDGDSSTPNNIFSQEEGPWEMYNTSASHWLESGKDYDLHRDGLLNADKTGPGDLTELSWLVNGEDATLNEKAISVYNYNHATTAANDNDNPATAAKETNYENVWLRDSASVAGGTATQGAGEKDVNGLYAITMADMKGVGYDDAKWDALLNQLTWTELINVVNNGGYKTPAVSSIGKPQVTDADGPQQMQSGWTWVGAPTIAATWNVELSYKHGEVVGNESVWANGVGWYGPAMNNHRNPLSGRNFEYYSQDGLQGGLIAAAVVGGCVDAGGRVYIKHAFLNDQETSRDNGVVFVNEQAIREIYAKPFELSIRKGHANGIMSAFNLIGLNSSASYAVNVQLYTNEWGYRGTTVTDFWASNSQWSADMMLRGLNMPLNGMGGAASGYSGTWDETDNVVKVNDVASTTQWYWAREMAHRILYTHINSAAGKNGFVAGSAVEEVNVMAGTINASIVNKAYLDDVFGADNYTVSAANLPDGLSLSTAGVLTGSYDEEGELQVTVTITGTNGSAWIGSGNAIVVVNVISDLSEYIEALQDEISSLRAQVQELQTTVSALQSALNSLNGDKTALESAIASLQSTIASLQARIAVLESAGVEGPKGESGANGKSAYEIWLEAGNTGTEQDFLNSLKGADGAKGDKGDAGEAGKGCGSVIGAGAAIVAGLTILGGAALAMKGKKD